MSKYFTRNIPWSSAELSAQTVIDHYVNRYAGRVFLDFVAGETKSMVIVPVLAGFVATGVGVDIESSGICSIDSN